LPRKSTQKSADLVPVPPRPDLVPDEVTIPPTTSSRPPLSRGGRGRGGDVERKSRKTTPSDHLINSLQKLTQCPVCKGWIYEMHLGGFRTRVEPTRLNFVEEVIHRLEGRKIYETVRRGYDFEIVERTLWHIKRSDPKAVVLPSHSCLYPMIFEPEPIYEIPTPKESEF